MTWRLLKILYRWFFSQIKNFKQARTNLCVCLYVSSTRCFLFLFFFPIPQSLRELGLCLSYAIKLVKIESINLTEKKRINPLSPSMHIQILQIDLHTFRLRIVERISFKIKAFSFGNQFSNSHNLHSWWSADVVRRKLMLVTLGTQRINPLGTYRATSSKPVNEIVAMYEQPGTGD